MISIQTRTDAHNAVLNSGHRDRFATATQFNVAVTTVWLSVRNGVIARDHLDAICDKIVDAEMAEAEAIDAGIDSEAERSRA
jgi:hypothetical protein